MIKRKNGVKAITTMVIVMIMFIISVLPGYAASYLSEVSVSTDFIILITNHTKEAYNVTLNIVYQDENGDTLHEEVVSRKVDAVKTVAIDAKDYYNSEKTQKVVAEIVAEKNVKGVNKGIIILIIAAVSFLLAIVFFIISNRSDKYGVLWFIFGFVAIIFAVSAAFIGGAIYLS